MHALIAVQSLSARSSIARRGNLKSSGEKKGRAKSGKDPDPDFGTIEMSRKRFEYMLKREGFAFFPEIV